MVMRASIQNMHSFKKLATSRAQRMRNPRSTEASQRHQQKTFFSRARTGGQSPGCSPLTRLRDLTGPDEPALIGWHLHAALLGLQSLGALIDQPCGGGGHRRCCLRAPATSRTDERPSDEQARPGRPIARRNSNCLLKTSPRQTLHYIDSATDATGAPAQPVDRVHERAVPNFDIVT